MGRGENPRMDEEREEEKATNEATLNVAKAAQTAVEVLKASTEVLLEV